MDGLVLVGADQGGGHGQGHGMNQGAGQGSSPGSGRRWEQFIYGSFNAGRDGRGGWRIKERTPGLTEAELETLRPWIVTQFDSHVEASDFPGEAEIASMPRRFSYVCDSFSQGRYWHAAMAGRDTTGRPGNVFSQVILDRKVDNPTPAFRPIELWDSADIQRPYGVDAVNSAQLTPSSVDERQQLPFRLGIDRQSVLDFLFDPGQWRVGTLAVLLDGLSAAVAGGPAVVIECESTQNAALWTAAASYLCSPIFARHINFSLYERPAALRSAVGRGFHLISVPQGESEILAETPAVVVLDEDETPNIGEIDGNPHRTAAGSQIAAGYWGALAQDALATRESAEEALTEIDFISSKLSNTGWDPAWPLAMASIRKPHIFLDSAPEALAVLTKSSPETVREHQEIQEQVMTVVQASAGTTAASALADAMAVPPTSAIAEALIRRYLQLVFVDSNFQLQQGPIPLPAAYTPAMLTPELRATAINTVHHLRSQVIGGQTPSVVAAVKLLDFITSAKFFDLAAEPPEFQDTHAELLEAIVASVVDSEDDAAALVTGVAGLGSQELAQQLREAARRTRRFQEAPAGQRLPLALRNWWFPGIDLRTLQQQMYVPVGEFDPMLVELALWVCAGGADANFHGAAKVIAGVGLLASYPQLVGAPPELARATFSNRFRWTAPELLLIESNFPKILPGQLFVPALLLAPWDQQLQQLCQLVAARGDFNSQALDVRSARLRQLAESVESSGLSSLDTWVDGEPFMVRSHANLLLDTAEQAINSIGRLLTTPNVAALLVVSAIVVKTRGTSSRLLSEALGRQFHAVPVFQDFTVSRALIRSLNSDVIADDGAMSLAWISFEAGQTSEKLATEILGSDFGTALEPALLELAAVKVAMADSMVPVLEVPIRYLLHSEPGLDPEYLLEGFLQLGAAGLNVDELDRREEKSLAIRQSNLRHWWEQICTSSGREIAEKPAFFDSWKSVLRKER